MSDKHILWLGLWIAFAMAYVVYDETQPPQITCIETTHGRACGEVVYR